MITLTDADVYRANMNEREIRKQMEPDARDSLESAAAALANLVPVVGGAIGSVLSSQSTDRRMRRAAEVIQQVADQVQGLEAEVAQDYMASEEFEDLLEATVRRAADERNEERRQLLGKFLVNAMLEGAHDYDEQVRIVELTKFLQPLHVTILRASLQDSGADEAYSGMGSEMGTLEKRLQSRDRELIQSAISDLNSWRLTAFSSTNMMTMSSSADRLSHNVTPFGQKLVRYLSDPS